MASKTTNYNLHKIDLADSPPDITVLNPNFDLIDGKLKEFESGKVNSEVGKGLSTNDYTTEDKNKLTNITSGAEVNQNAFSFVKVGTTSIAADSKTDTLEIVAGSNITVTPDATNDKLTFAVSIPVSSVNGKTGAITLSATEVGAVSNQTFTAHLEDDEAHVTPAERTKWNGAITDIGTKTSLLTTNKTNLVSAVNELFTNVSNGKAIVGTAITDIDPNVIVPEEPTFHNLADAIGQINTGKKWASGIASVVTSGSFTSGQNSSLSSYSIEVNGITFKPSKIIIIGKELSNRNSITLYDEELILPSTGVSIVRSEAFYINGNMTSSSWKLGGNANVSNTGFRIPVGSDSYAPYRWIAYE